MLGTSAVKATLLGGAAVASALHYSQQGFVAPVWGELSFAIWCAVLVLPAALPVAWERRQIAWGLLSVCVFEYFVLFVDPDFKVTNTFQSLPVPVSYPMVYYCCDFKHWYQHGRVLDMHCTTLPHQKGIAPHQPVIGRQDTFL